MPVGLRLAAAYGRLLGALAALAAAILAAAVVLITLDVAMRNFGIQPPAHTLALTEYGLLYATMLGAPWLLRVHGHVHVEVVVNALPGPARAAADKIVCLLGIVACLAVAWASAEAAVANFERGTFDMRSFDMPKWLLLAPLPPAFAMMAGEFVRFLLGRAPLHGEGPDLGGRT
jgi:TRAP-type C4-dicarboxylate transport system permease small subunit